MRLMDKIVKEDRSEENLNNIRTIQVNSPHEHNHILQTYTPQPSTPIKHAGSVLGIWMKYRRIPYFSPKVHFYAKQTTQLP